jgi:hypothetical protein
LPPSESTSNSALTDATMNNAPSQSMARRRRGNLNRSARSVTSSATTPIGMPTQNVHRQDPCSTRNPPASGPATVARANTEPM